MATLSFLGAAGTVTGSKHLLEVGGKRILVDCGLFQGLKNLRELNCKPLPDQAQSVDAVVLTHAHVDHAGYLPRLVKAGYRGPVYCTPGTADVAGLILRDSAHLQEHDAYLANKYGFTRHTPAEPLYTLVDAEQAISLFRPIGFHQPTELRPLNATATFRRAGHILGAATVQIDWGGRRVVFSGDLGRYSDPVMLDPDPVAEADVVVVESTYGDRAHEDRDPAQAVGEIVRDTVARGGTLLVPAFAVGRAQSLLYHLWRAREQGLFPGRVPIYLDSPMSINATELLSRHPDDHRLTQAQCAAAFGIATYVRDPELSKSLSADTSPKVIISASGMASGGRVLHHLAAFGGDERSTVLLTGFQAPGTRGRALLRGEREIRIYGEWKHIGAEVRELRMLSAHADAGELLRWLGRFKPAPSHAFIVHGEPEASEALRMGLRRKFGWEARVPRHNQTFNL